MVFSPWCSRSLNQRVTNHGLDSYKSFMTLYVPSQNVMTYHPGLVKGCREVFPSTTHRHCLHHLRNNFKKVVRRLGIPNSEALSDKMPSLWHYVDKCIRMFQRCSKMCSWPPIIRFSDGWSNVQPCILIPETFSRGSQECHAPHLLDIHLDLGPFLVEKRNRL
ncbi:hypothetical protein M5K25_026320 [Dendrobium thyrsiflorum]|uniref:MULE transposase domain-containing protein n=1 Tax=Dendrobium thyrsiflorum TaxID=117978 RepID=A0ABD0TX37_DENTH